MPPPRRQLLWTGAQLAVCAASERRAFAPRGSRQLHLLTPAFFTDLHAVLAADGKLTILSDNGRYCRALCATLGALPFRELLPAGTDFELVRRHGSTHRRHARRAAAAPR